MSTRLVGWALRDAPELHPDLSTGARLLLVYLADHFNEDEGAAWPSQARLARLMGCTDRAVRKWLDELQAAQLVRVHRADREGKSNLYRMTTPERGSGVPGTRFRPTPERGSADPGTRFRLSSKEPLKRTAPPAEPETVAAHVATIRAAMRGASA
jgi:hypothetical protein